MNSMQSLFTLCAAVGCLLGLATVAHCAETFTDDFSSGVDPQYWTVVGHTNLYTLDDSMGELRISKPVGGEYIFQSLGLTFRSKLRGDFDVSVDMTNASITRVDGVPGNQIQLNLRFGGQGFYVVRSDENFSGNNLHVFLDPPVTWVGTLPSTATSGRLRVVRTGTQVQGWFDSTLIFQGNYNAEDAEVNFDLHNNGTRDATAVTFDKFSITADEIVVSPTLTIVPAGSSQAIISWSPGTGTNWVLQETLNLSPPNWTNSSSGSTNPIVVPAMLPKKFYRLFKP